MTTASPIYWLLSHPSWIGERREGQEEIINNLGRGGWDFDPNETHAGVPVMRAFLQAQTRYVVNPDEKATFQVIQALLDRGADADALLAGEDPTLRYGSKIRWDIIPSVRSLILSAQSGQLEPVEELAILMMSALRETQDPAEMESKVIPLLDNAKGWKTPIQGIAPGAWIALNAMGQGRNLPGWADGCKQVGGHLAALVRGCRKLVQLSGLEQEANGPTDRLLAASGLIALASTCSSTMDDSRAQANAYKLAHKLVEALPLDISVENIVRSSLCQEIKARAGASLIRTLPVLFNGKPGAWGPIAQAWPLLQSDRIDTTVAFRDLVSVMGSPESSFFNQIEPTSHNQNLLVSLVMSGFGYASDYTLKAKHGVALTRFLEWQEMHASKLPCLDIDNIMAIGGNKLAKEPELSALLEAFSLKEKTATIERKRESRHRL